MQGTSGLTLTLALALTLGCGGTPPPVEHPTTEVGSPQATWRVSPCFASEGPFVVAETAADGTVLAFSDEIRARMRGDALEIAPQAIGSGVVDARRIGDGWVFTTRGGGLAQSEDFLGEARAIGHFAETPERFPDARGAIVTMSHAGGFEIFEPEAGVRALPQPEGVAVVSAAVEWPARIALVVSPGRLVVSTDRGATFAPVALAGDPVALRVSSEAGALRVVTSAGVTCLDDAGASRACPEPRAPSSAEVRTRLREAVAAASAACGSIATSDDGAAIIALGEQPQAVSGGALVSTNLPEDCTVVGLGSVALAACRVRYLHLDAWVSADMRTFRSIGMISTFDDPAPVSSPGSSTFVVHRADFTQEEGEWAWFDGSTLVPVPRSLIDRGFHDALSVHGALALVRHSGDPGDYGGSYEDTDEEDEADESEDESENESESEVPDGIYLVHLDTHERSLVAMPDGLEQLGDLSFTGDGSVIGVGSTSDGQLVIVGGPAGAPLEVRGPAPSVERGSEYAQGTDLVLAMLDDQHGLAIRSPRDAAWSTEDGGRTWVQAPLAEGDAPPSGMVFREVPATIRCTHTACVAAGRAVYTSTSATVAPRRSRIAESDASPFDTSSYERARPSSTWTCIAPPSSVVARFAGPFGDAAELDTARDDDPHARWTFVDARGGGSSFVSVGEDVAVVDWSVATRALAVLRNGGSQITIARAGHPLAPLDVAALLPGLHIEAIVSSPGLALADGSVLARVVVRTRESGDRTFELALHLGSDGSVLASRSYAFGPGAHTFDRAPAEGPGGALGVAVHGAGGWVVHPLDGSASLALGELPAAPAPCARAASGWRVQLERAPVGLRIGDRDVDASAIVRMEGASACIATLGAPTISDDAGVVVQVTNGALRGTALDARWSRVRCSAP